jgi:hypothetical protein
MGKSAFQTFSIAQFINELDFKTKAIFFDQIFIHASFFEAVFESNIVIKHLTFNGQNIIKQNFLEIEYLLKQGIVCEYKSHEKLELDAFEEDMKDDIIEFHKYEKFLKSLEGRDDLSIDDHFQMNNVYFDYITRFSCRDLTKNGYGDVIPLLASPQSFLNRNSKQEVLFFTLDKLPQPSSDTSWEQIIDFRSDPDSKVKYLALIQWINKTASSNIPMNEVEDEYE